MNQSQRRNPHDMMSIRAVNPYGNPWKRINSSVEINPHDPYDRYKSVQSCITNPCLLCRC